MNYRNRMICVLSIFVLMLALVPTHVFAYDFRYEQRLALIQFRANHSITEGPVLERVEFYEQILQDAYSSEISNIVDAYMSGDMEETLSKWHTHMVGKEYSDDLRSALELSKTVEELMEEDIDWQLADSGLNRTHAHDDYVYSFDTDIDWTYNPTYSDQDVEFDPEWTWTLNRHSWWVEMAKAAIVSGNDQYSEELARQMRSWISSQVPGFPSVGQDFLDQELQYIWYSNAFHPGILNHDDSDPFEYWLTDSAGNQLVGTSASWRTLETGIRLTEWLKTIYYFRASEFFDPELAELVTRSVVDQMTWLGVPNHFSQGHEWEVYETDGLRNALDFFPELLLSEKFYTAANKRFE